MNAKRIGGIVLLIVGLGLFIVGLNASDSIADQVSEFFTGHFTDATVWYILGGIAIAVCGFFMLILPGRIDNA